MILLPDGIGHSPRVKEPESAMLPGMATPAAREPDRALFRGRPILTPERRAALPSAIVAAIDAGELTGLEWLALLASMPDTSMNNPIVAAAPPLQLVYDYDPNTGVGRILVPGTVEFQPSVGGGIVGVPNGIQAPAGAVGEYQQSSVGPQALTTSVIANVGSLALTPGDWDIWGQCIFTISAGASLITAGVNNVSATFAGNVYSSLQATTATIATSNLNCPAFRIGAGAAWTLFLVAQAVFASGTVSASGTLFARRRR